MSELWLFRRASTKAKEERGIFVKHFRNIPMADMEIVLVSPSLSLFPNGPGLHSSFYIFFIFFLEVWIQRITWYNLLPLTAWEEEPRINSNGLGQVPWLCGSWAGQFFNINEVCLVARFLPFLILWNAAYYFFLLQVAVISSLEMPNADFWVIIAVLSTVIGYCAKIYFR